MTISIKKQAFQGSIGIISLLCARSLFADPTPVSFIPITPCRVVDTRTATGSLGGPLLQPGTRDFPILSGTCGIPDTAVAYSINVTASPVGHLNFLTIWATGQDQPATSTLNSNTGGVVANGVRVTAGTSGSVTVYTTDETHLVLDIDGYFIPAATSGVGPAGPTGPTGATGATGETGAAGPQGAPGATGATGAPGTPGPAFLGAWSSTATYAANEAVYYNGSSYFSLVGSNVGMEPDTSTAQWSLLAQGGATGATGPTGSAGPTGPTGPTGATGPQGPAGIPGITGAAGTNGTNGTNGFNGPNGSSYFGASVAPIGSSGTYYASINGAGQGASSSEITQELLPGVSCSSEYFGIIAVAASGGNVGVALRKNGVTSGILACTGSPSSCLVEGSVAIQATDILDIQITSPGSVGPSTILFQCVP